jgi:hypothetical protein
MSTQAQAQSAAANQRRVAFATIIGTTVEWYDFFIYATAAGLVFADLFFKPAGDQIGLLLALPRWASASSSGRWVPSWPATTATRSAGVPCWCSPWS